MEERIIDRDKRIKLKRTEEGVDAVDETAEPEGEAQETEEEEIFFDLPEGDEYDDDLVGLTPSQLQARLAAKKREEEKARAEFEKLAAEGAERIEAGDYAGAVPVLEHAVTYECADGAAKRNLWVARTENFTSIDVFTEESAAQEFSWADTEVREEVFEKLRGRLEAWRKELRGEAEPLRADYTEKYNERREAFRANQRYYLLRFFLVLGAFLLLAIGCGVSASFLLRVQSSLPLVLCAVFGVLALGVFVLFVYFARKLFVAWRLVRDNEDPASTEEGSRLAALDRSIAALDLVLWEE